MSFVEEVRTAADSRRHGESCSVQRLMQALGESERVEFQTALDGPYQSSAIAEAARARGWDVGAPTIRRHRRRDCQCRTS